jgi:D-3-phosphoglycerate dehydrogenase
MATYQSRVPEPLLGGGASIRVVVVGDAGTSPAYFAKMARNLAFEDVEVVALEWPGTIEEIQARLLNIELNGPEAEEPPEALLEEIVDADVLLVHVCPVPDAVIRAGKNLKLIGLCRGGLDNLDVGSALRRGIKVFHVVRNAEPVADFTLGLILAETRNIARGHASIVQGEWRKKFSNSAHTTTLRELRVGLLGLGNIGRLLAGKLAALGVEVWGWDPYLPEAEQGATQIERRSIEEIFSDCDVVSVHLRHSEETDKLIGRDLITRMKPSSYLINTSRAAIIDEGALVEALTHKKIAGAALDVLWEEPLPARSALLTLDNVTLTPHIAGDTVDAIPKSPKLLVEVINDYLRHRRTDFLVTK